MKRFYCLKMKNAKICKYENPDEHCQSCELPELYTKKWHPDTTKSEKLKEIPEDIEHESLEAPEKKLIEAVKSGKSQSEIIKDFKFNDADQLISHFFDALNETDEIPSYTFLAQLKHDLHYGIAEFDFEDIEFVIEEVSAQLGGLCENYQKILDNMPEKTSEFGIMLQEQIDALEKAIDALESYEMFDEPEEEWSDIIDDWENLDDEDREESIEYYKDELKSDQIREVASLLYSNLPGFW